MEIQEKRAKGECYNCDQKWSISHKCKNQYLLLVGEDDANQEVGEDGEEDEIAIQGDISSLSTLSGTEKSRSLRLWGRIDERQMHVLIDSGSTHNFVRPDVAERLGIPISTISPFRVYVGSGDSLICRYKCERLEIELQGSVFNVGLYVLPLQGPEIVLGMSWLQELGKVVHDYTQLTMEFLWKGVRVTLQGVGGLEP